VIDEVSRDEVLEAYGVVDPDKAKHTIESWREYLAEHRSEISAIELMFEASKEASASTRSRNSPTGSHALPTTGPSTSSGTLTSPSESSTKVTPRPATGTRPPI
jgi:type I restriction enzyme R subunit